ncbi:MAG: rhomboid family intramembrane serine protease, partial [Pseudomonadota bacterium]|nr:rhomboid family intramembrane serine protease [Pseudomonadota bacterium]
MPLLSRTPSGPRQPMLNLPPMVQALILTSILVFAITWFLSDDAWTELMMRWAFIPARYGEDPASLDAVLSPFTSLFLHGGFLHLGINMVSLAAFGSGIERYLGSTRMLALYLLCGLAGSAVHLAFHWGSPVPVIGASGAISGLFGGLAWILGRQHGNIIALVL